MWNEWIGVYGYNPNKSSKEVVLNINEKNLSYAADISDSEYYLLTFKACNVFNIVNSNFSRIFWVNGYVSYDEGVASKYTLAFK